VRSATGRATADELRVVALGGDQCGERRGVRRPTTGVCGIVDGHSSALESEDDGGGAVVKTVTQLDVGDPAHRERTEYGWRLAPGEGWDDTALWLIGEVDRWWLSLREAVATQPGIDARWGAAVSGYCRGRSSGDGGSARHRPTVLSRTWRMTP
jgi:hypothetical protein